MPKTVRKEKTAKNIGILKRDNARSIPRICLKNYMRNEQIHQTCQSIKFNVEELKYEYKIQGDIGFKKNQYAIVNVGKTATYLIAPPFCCKVSAKTDNPRCQANILALGVETKCKFRCKKISDNVVHIIEEHLPGCQKIMPMTDILGDLNLNIKGTIQLLGQNILNTHKVLNEVGRGGFGKVFCAKSKIDGNLYAVKCIDKSPNINFHQILAERNALRIVSHLPCVTKLFKAFQSPSKFIFLMEYVPGKMDILVRKKAPFSEEITSFYIGQLLMGIEALQINGILHRDLKPGNLMMAANGYVKIADFGLAVTGVFGNCQTSGLCGTISYMAPEIFQQRSYGKPVDFWSIGVMVYQFLVGRLPFLGRNRQEVIDKITGGQCDLSGLSIKSIALINGLLTRDPSRRLVEEARRCPFFDAVDFKVLAAQQYNAPYIPNLPDQNFIDMDELTTFRAPGYQNFSNFTIDMN